MAKTIIVTGASRGLGAAPTEILDSEEVNLVLSARSEEDLQEVAARIAGDGRSAGSCSGCFSLGSAPRVKR